MVRKRINPVVGDKDPIQVLNSRNLSLVGPRVNSPAKVQVDKLSIIDKSF